MRIQIFGHHVLIDGAMRSHIDARVRLALGRVSPRVARVSVYLSDENGPRGGVDKQCRLVAKLIPQGDLVVQGSDAEWEPLLNIALSRLARKVVREVDRGRSRWSRSNSR